MGEFDEFSLNMNARWAGDNTPVRGKYPFLGKKFLDAPYGCLP
jgi:hypothetical protein